MLSTRLSTGLLVWLSFELLGDAAPESGGALDSPLAVGPLRGPRQERRRGAFVHGESDRGMGLPVGFDRDRGQGALVGVDADDDHQLLPFHIWVEGTAAGNLTFGWITPLLSHTAAGVGRVRTLLISQPGGGKGTCEPDRSDTLDTVGLQTRDVWAQ